MNHAHLTVMPVKSYVMLFALMTLVAVGILITSLTIIQAICCDGNGFFDDLNIKFSIKP